MSKTKAKSNPAAGGSRKALQAAADKAKRKRAKKPASPKPTPGKNALATAAQDPDRTHWTEPRVAQHWTDPPA